MATNKAVFIRNVCLILFILIRKSRSAANVAYLKTATQSSVFSGAWVASKVVDGCTSTNIGSNCCTHTQGVGPKQVWWRVDLGGLMTINKITIYYRSGFQKRLAGYQLYLSNTTNNPTDGVLCYEDKSSALNQVQLIVTHQCPYVAQYVTVYNYRNDTTRYNWYDEYAVLELCEVQVYGCAVGSYGDGDCMNQCSNDCYGGNCNSTTGVCLYCSQGMYGDYCASVCSSNCKDNNCEKNTGHCIECPQGKYGILCTDDCSLDCKDTNCEKNTGFCIECVPKKYGNTCEFDCSVNCKEMLCAKDTGFCNECISGKYGNMCENNCSSNCQDRKCARGTGDCNECIPGKYGNKCEQTCPGNCKNMLCIKDGGNCIECIDGKYGMRCDQTCPANCKDMRCTQDGGDCIGCKPGKHGSTCADECPINCKDNECNQTTGLCQACIPPKRGEVCEQDCPPNCLNGICDKITAACLGCKGGFHGTNCSTPCHSDCTGCDQRSGECTNCTKGLYGKNCSMSCGRCTTCEINSGLCGTPCDPGYEGSFCERQSQIADPATDSGPIIGGVVGAILVVVIAIVVVFIIRRRRLRDNKHDSFDDIGHSKEYSEPLEVAGKNVDRGKPVVENVYSNTVVSEEDPDEPEESTTNVYINAEQVSRKSGTEDSVYYNSGPVGFPVSKLKSLVQTKMQNKAKAFEIEYKSIPSGSLHDHNVGMLPQNKAKNRFKTTFPYDHSRVVLDVIGKDLHSDYINANYIDSVTKTAEYVATQGPRLGTINDFWRMIWQLNSGKIVMLTNLIEGSRPKCDKYWPDEGEPLSTTHFNIVLDRERAYAFYVIRDIIVTEKKTKSVRQIHQFHYTTWPDHGTPDPNELVVFHRRVKQYETVCTGKMVVHCSAGIGRTGTYLALDALLDYGKEAGRIDVMQYIKTMRKDRVNMVQTAEQYIAIHQILVEAFDMPDTLIPRMKYHKTYSDISNNGPKNQTKLRQEYQLTQTLKPKLAETDCKAALLPANKQKNRTLTVLAADKFRAYLRSQAPDRTDYINAVAVPSYTSKTGYIVTQTPMEDTVVDMLTLIMDHNCQTIVIIETDVIDWLPEDGKDKTVGNFTLERKGKSSTIANVDLIEIAIHDQINEIDTRVRVFLLSGWERDAPVPKDSSWLLQALELVDSRRKSDNTKTTVVMCRDGYSQSGLFCCISNARDQMKIDEEVDIFQASRQLLVRRPEFLVNFNSDEFEHGHDQTVNSAILDLLGLEFEQYHCCYNMIRDYLDTTDVYVN